MHELYHTEDFEVLHKKTEEMLIMKQMASCSLDTEEQVQKLLYEIRSLQLKMKLLNKQLIKAKARANEDENLKSAYLANVSHEIRTPVNGILGFAELLKNPALNRKKQDNYIGIIQKSGNHLLTLVNDLISISKIEKGKMKVSGSETNLNDALEYIYSFFKLEADEKGIQLLLEHGLPIKDAVVYSDQNKINAILINLVKNAIKFTEKGAIKIGCIKEETSLVFYVKDTGIGIENEHKNIIFERFIRVCEGPELKYNGEGLGLSIAKAYVELLGGRIWVESKPGEGSEFYFTIPVDFVKKERTGIKEQNIFIKPVVESVNNLKILIAEDDKFSEMLVRELLNGFAREIITVKSGNKAVDFCRSNPDVDLVLMDIRMPELNGFEATKQIRLFNSEVIIIAQTASVLNNEWEQAIDAGCNDYVSKIFTTKLLDKLLKKHFGNRIIKNHNPMFGRIIG